MHRKYAEVWMCGFCNMRVDRQTDKQTDMHTTILHSHTGLPKVILEQAASQGAVFLGETIEWHRTIRAFRRDLATSEGMASFDFHLIDVGYKSPTIFLPPSNTSFLAPTRVHIPIGILISSDVFLGHPVVNKRQRDRQTRRPRYSVALQLFLVSKVK